MVQNPQREYKYYYKKKKRVIAGLVLAGILVSAIFLIFGVNHEVKKVRELFSTAVLTQVYLAISFIHLAMTMFKPVLIISPEHLVVMRKKILWADIRNMSIVVQKVMGSEMKILRVERVKKGFLPLFPHQLDIASLDESAEVIMRLRERYPDLDASTGGPFVPQAKAVVDLRHTRPETSVRYRELVFSPGGIQVGSRAIGWDKVTGVAYQKHVISGYGETYLTYLDATGPRTLTVRPMMSRSYHSAVLYLLHYARNANIDPQLVAMLNVSPADMRINRLCTVSIIGGMLLGFSATFFMMLYAVKEHSGLMPLMGLFVPFVVGLVAALLLLQNQKGTRIPASLRALVSSAVPLSVVAVIWIFFSTAPVAWPLVMGEVNYKLDRYEQAEASYRRAIKIDPGSIDAMYSMGLYLINRNRPEEALPYLEKAYQGDIRYWGLRLMKLIPQTHAKLGRQQEALRWCDRIIADHKRSNSIVSEMLKLRGTLAPS